MSDALSIAQTRLDGYIQAETRILARGQDIGVMQSRRRDAELREIRQAIRDLQTEVATLSSTAGGQTRLITAVVR